MAKKQLDDARCNYTRLCGDADVQLTGVRWEAIGDEERRVGLRTFLRESWDLSDAAAERLDAQICANCCRLYAAIKGSRQPHRNDGIDVNLTIHIGERGILLTNDCKLIKLVDGSGTYQRPWVRRPDDMGMPQSVLKS
jgi:hypothetical protein